MIKRLRWITLLMFMLAPVAATAQDQSSLRELLATIQAERARIAELQAALDHQEAAIVALSARVTQLAASSPSASPEPATAAAKSDQSQRFDFYGDSTIRLADQRQSFPGCDGCPGRTIGRLRLRFGAEGHLAPGLRVVMGFGLGELNNPNTIYQTLGGNFTRKAATWDRGFMEFRPAKAPWIDLTAGKFPYTWLRSSMTFDVDFYPEGLSERFPFDLKRAGPLKNITVQGLQLIVNEQAGAPDMTIIGGQTTATVQSSARLKTTLAFTALDVKRPVYLLRAQLDGSDPGVLNTNAIRREGEHAFYVSGFRYSNLILENSVRTPWEALPATIGVEYQRNQRASRGTNTGKSVRLDVGRAQRRGDWGFGWHFFRVEQDAILAGLGESDWRAPSNVLQHRIAVNRMLHANVQAAFTWYRGRTLDRDAAGAVLLSGLPPGGREPWRNLFYLDLIYRY